MHRAQNTMWDIAINLGVKCNLLPISRKAKIRYISSPFDNMDSVDGLIEIGDLLASRFENYFNKSAWDIRNDYPSKSNQIRAKIAWNKNYPGLYYPHFHHKWLSNISETELANWVSNPEGDIDFVWRGLSQTFKRRQERLIEITEERNSILFLRLEDKANLRRTIQRDTATEALAFEKAITNAYPNLNFAMAYFYYDSADRHFESTEHIYFDKIPMDCDEEFLIKKLSQFKLAPPKASFDQKGD